MKLYSCKVRLGGSLLNEVRKEKVTAAEIQLLRVLHSSADGGNDPVIEITHTHDVKRTDATERARLAGAYSKTDPAGYLSGHDLVLKYFGAPGVPLPAEAEAPLEATEIDAEDEIIKSLDDEEIEEVSTKPVLPVATRTRRIQPPQPVATRTRRIQPPQPVELNALTA